MKKLVLLFTMLVMAVIEPNAQLVDVVVEEYGSLNSGGYPEGYTTYRVYGRLQDSDDRIATVYGYGILAGPDHYLSVGAFPNGVGATTLWNSPFGGTTAQSINPALCGVFPEACYDSFVTIGKSSSLDPGGEIFTVSTPAGAFENSFGTQNVYEEPLILGDGAWFSVSNDVNTFGVGPDNRVLLLQATVPTGTLKYALNLQVFDGMAGPAEYFLYEHHFQSNIFQTTEANVTLIDYTCQGLVYPNICSAEYGCTDPLACNYSAEATILSNCIYPTCSDPLAANYDAFGECGGGECVYYECNDPDACNYNPEATNNDACVYAGCTDPLACNWSAIFGCDDGSCQYAGCNDPAALNFNPDAGCDDGSCVFSACNDPLACNYAENVESADNSTCCYENCMWISAADAFGDGWNGADLVIYNSEGVEVVSYTLEDGQNGTYSFCLESGCYSLAVSQGTWWTEVSWTLHGANQGDISGIAPDSAEFSVGLDSPCGCTDPSACNFSEFAIYDDGTCLFNDACWGCMDSEAVNYDDVAIWDDGSCQYTISAIVFYDTNGNGNWEMDEPGLEGWSAYVPEVNATLFTDENGYFYLAEFAPGDYTLELTSDNPDWVNTTPLIQTVTVPNPSIAAEFGFIPTGSEALFEVNTFSSLGIIGCVTGVDLGIWLENDGAVPLNGTFTLEFDPSLTASAAGGVVAPDEIGAGYVTWNILNQPIGVGLMYSVHINGPGFDDLNDVFQFTRNLVLNDDGDEYYNNSWDQNLTVACSFDPNDKQADPIGYAEPHYILGTERIEYTIRFQNTGNYPAEDILITDQLDMSVLDISTFELNYGTLPFYTCLHDDGLLEFMFVDVFLPDSVNNEPESHGLVSFSIEPLDNLPPGTVINNTAEIFFDQNPAVVTNTTYHTLFNCESFEGISGDLDFCEGATTVLNSEQAYVESYTWTIEDEVAGQAPELEVSELPAGEYLVSVYVENPLCGNTREEMLLVYETPVVEAGADIELCLNESANLNASSDVPGDFTWNNGLGSGASQSFVPQTTSTYEVTLTTEFGCSDVDDVSVVVHDLPGTLITQNGDLLTAPDGNGWQWYMGTEEIEGATSQDYVVLEDGLYSVVTTNEFGCTAGSEAVFVVGVHNVDSGVFSIYPNPVSDLLTVVAPGGSWTLKIFNSIGQEVNISQIIVENAYLVDVSFLSPGTYQLLIINPETTVSRRISIQ